MLLFFVKFGLEEKTCFHTKELHMTLIYRKEEKEEKIDTLYFSSTSRAPHPVCVAMAIAAATRRERGGACVEEKTNNDRTTRTTRTAMMLSSIPNATTRARSTTTSSMRRIRRTTRTTSSSYSSSSSSYLNKNKNNKNVNNNNNNNINNSACRSFSRFMNSSGRSSGNSSRVRNNIQRKFLLEEDVDKQQSLSKRANKGMLQSQKRRRKSTLAWKSSKRNSIKKQRLFSRTL